MAVRAVRGAIQVEDRHPRGHPRGGHRAGHRGHAAQRARAPTTSSASVFTATPDLTAEFPAYAARLMGSPTCRCCARPRSRCPARCPGCCGCWPTSRRHAPRAEHPPRVPARRRRPAHGPAAVSARRAGAVDPYRLDGAGRTGEHRREARTRVRLHRSRRPRRPVRHRQIDRGPAARRRLGARYLDTGAMYRAATRGRPASRRHAPTTRTRSPGSSPRPRSRSAPTRPTSASRLDGEPVDARDPHAAGSPRPSAPSAPCRRCGRTSWPQQRELIGARRRSSSRAATSARSSGRTARPKVYLTADPEVRARRRAGAGRRRRRRGRGGRPRPPRRLDSSRAASPLAVADDAIELDTTTLDIDAGRRSALPTLAVGVDV